MNFKRVFSAGAIALASLLGIANAPAHAAGLWQTLPGIGYPSYCASLVSGVTLPAGQGPYGVVPGSTQGNGSGICGQTVPAGPTVFAGTEYLPLDIGPLGSTSNGAPPTSAVTRIEALGNGPVVDSVASGAALTIPNNTGYFVLDTGTAATVAITFPALAYEGDIIHLDCKVAVGTALSVVANTGQTVVGASPTTCAAGAGYSWRYVATANGLIVAGSWLRIQ